MDFSSSITYVSGAHLTLELMDLTVSVIQDLFKTIINVSGLTLCNVELTKFSRGLHVSASQPFQDLEESVLALLIPSF